MKKVYFFGALGSIIEWYDFAIYGYLAPIFAQIFFVDKSHWAAIVQVYAIFFFSYLSRPIGALLYGYIGDHFGRKPALIFSVAMMSLTMLIIALLPTWHVIGSMAPLLLFTFRIIQGISVGGETSGTFVYILESANAKHYGLFGSSAGAISVVGILLGSSVITLLSYKLSHQALLDWGWRLAYLIGFAGGLVIFILRVFMPESSAFQKLQESMIEPRTSSFSPLKTAFKNHKQDILIVACLSAMPAVGFYFTFVYYPQYIQQYFHQTLSKSMYLNTLLLPIKIAVTILFGYIADFVGKKNLATLSAICFLFLSYPVLHLASGGSWNAIVTVQIILALMLALYSGTFPGMLVEITPLKVRYTIIASGFNIGYAIFGGTAPLICSLLIHWSHNYFIPAFYFMLVACLALGTLWSIRMRQVTQYVFPEYR